MGERAGSWVYTFWDEEPGAAVAEVARQPLGPPAEGARAGAPAAQARGTGAPPARTRARSRSPDPPARSRSARRRPSCEKAGLDMYANLSTCEKAGLDMYVMGVRGARFDRLLRFVPEIGSVRALRRIFSDMVSDLPVHSFTESGISVPFVHLTDAVRLFWPPGWGGAGRGRAGPGRAGPGRAGRGQVSVAR